MIFRDPKRFYDHLKTTPRPQACMIIGQGMDEAIQAYLALWHERPMILDAENFSIDFFFQETQTRPFLTARTCIHLMNIQHLSSKDILNVISFLKNPSPWVIFLISGEVLPPKSPFFAVFEQTGICLKIEEKSWEKGTRLAQWLVQHAQKSQVTLPLSVAQSMVKSLGEDSGLLKNELEKLICYVGIKNKIVEEDLQRISNVTSIQTIWQLGDALFLRDYSAAYRIGNQLLDGGTPLFTLIAQLRAQITTNLAILQAFQSAGKEKVAALFPYLKGSLMEKKINMLHNYTLNGLQYALIATFEAELAAKNGSEGPKCYFESLIFKLSHALPITQSSRSFK